MANPKLFIIVFLIIIMGSFVFPICFNRKFKKIIFLLLLIMGLSIFLFQALYYFGFFVDDSFISIRYAQSLAEGYGLNFNRDGSKPIEGYSNFLWVILEVPAFILGIEPIMYVKVLGLLLGLLGLILIYMLGSKLSGDNRVGLVSLWMMASVPMFALWSVGGLETMLFMVLGLLVVLMWISEKSGLLLGLSMLAVGLARNEGIIYFMLWLIMILIKDKGKLKRQDLICCLVTISGFIIYEVWRIIYFGDFLPNSFYMKVKFSWDEMVGKVLSKGPFYYYLSPLFLLAVYNFIGEKKKRIYFYLMTLTLILGLSGLLTFREWMPGFRYCLPMIPFLIILAVTAIVNIYDKSKVRYLLATVISFVIFSHLLLGNIFIYEARVSYKDTFNGYYETVDFLNKNATEDSTVALDEMGFIPFYSKIKKFYDINYVGLIRDKNIDSSNYHYILDFRADYLILIYDDEPPDGKILSSLRQPLQYDPGFNQRYELVKVIKKRIDWFYI